MPLVCDEPLEELPIFDEELELPLCERDGRAACEPVFDDGLG
jgi:hypothetical protein